MATGAIRLIGRKLPIDEIGIGQMTIGALRVTAVIQRLIRQTGVHEIIRCPPACVVTEIALLGRNKVAIVLAGCQRSVMTRRTAAKHLRVIDSGHRHPGNRSVAVFADVGALNMALAFASCVGTVVTA